MGTQEKVLTIRHDYQRAEWYAIGRILMYWYLKERHFPHSLSRAFLALCPFGEESSLFQKIKGRLFRNVLKERLIVMMMMC